MTGLVSKVSSYHSAMLEFTSTQCLCRSSLMLDFKQHGSDWNTWNKWFGWWVNTFGHIVSAFAITVMFIPCSFGKIPHLFYGITFYHCVVFTYVMMVLTSSNISVRRRSFKAHTESASEPFSMSLMKHVNFNWKWFWWHFYLSASADLLQTTQ